MAKLHIEPFDPSDNDGEDGDFWFNPDNEKLYGPRLGGEWGLFLSIEGLKQPGKPGLSAYEIAVKNGFRGTEKEWLRSLKGATYISGGGASGNGNDLDLSGVELLNAAQVFPTASPDVQTAINETNAKINEIIERLN